MKAKKFYFVGNAHIDPVWMWRWQDGSCEAKATLRSALDRMQEYPEFKFVCAATQVYEWIEEFDPEMFEEIRKRVAEGRFIPMGGMVIQPDCNLPSGEGFARQLLYGQRYFLDKFGITATTGYNVDSFGHNGMLPQLLKKAGIDSYVALRPGKLEKELPSNTLRWESPDGSQVLFSRIPRAYQTRYVNINDPRELDRLLEVVDEDTCQVPTTLFFYGVGNHGGGPTKKNIEAIQACRQRHPELELIFSDLNDYFEDLRTHWDTLPVLRDDLQHHASGCYSAVSAVKEGVRRAEWDLYQAELWNQLGRLAGRTPEKPEVFRDAWRGVLFTHFHDTLGGCSAKPAYEDADIHLKYSRGVAQRISNNNLQTLSWRIDTRDAAKGVPVMVFNPHPFPVRVPVRVPKHIERLYDEAGREVPTQLVRAHDVLCRYKGLEDDTLFWADLPALGWRTWYYHAVQCGDPGYSTFYCPDVSPEKPAYYNPMTVDGPHREAPTVFSNGLVEVTLCPRTGQVLSMKDLETGEQLLAGSQAAVIDEFGYDTWAHRENFFQNQVGIFTDAQITLLEQGPLRTRIQVKTRYNDSRLTQNFLLLAGERSLRVEAEVDWQEHRKQLKLRYDTGLPAEKAFYEIPYGVIERPADGEEEPGQSWIAVGRGKGMALLNDSKYSFSVRGGELAMTVVRSPYYNDHGRGIRNDPAAELTDQGRQRFAYTLLPFTGGWNTVTREAKLLNMGPTVVMENNHPGTLPTALSGLSCDRENVLVSVLKDSEDGKGLVLRAYETDGVQTRAAFTGPLLPVPLCAEFSPYSIQTYFLPRGGESWQEVLLTEL